MIILPQAEPQGSIWAELKGRDELNHLPREGGFVKTVSDRGIVTF